MGAACRSLRSSPLEALTVALKDLLKSVQKRSSSQILDLLNAPRAGDKALRTLWRAAKAREREQRRMRKSAGMSCRGGVYELQRMLKVLCGRFGPLAALTI
jgi:hypothetical protein